MTGNGLFKPPIDADLGDSLWLFYPDYKYIFIAFVKPSGTMSNTGSLPKSECGTKKEIGILSVQISKPIEDVTNLGIIFSSCWHVNPSGPRETY